MSRTRTRSGKHSFFYHLLAYAVFFLCIAAIGLIIEFHFLSDYEKTQSDRAVEKYMADLDIAHIRDMEQPFLRSLDTNIQPEDVSFGIISDFLNSGIKEYKDPARSDDHKLTYVLKCNDTVIGLFELQQSDETASFSQRPWHVSAEEFDFSFLISECDPFTVPEDYKVYCNGVLLDSSYITADDIRFDYLKDYYDSGYDLPYLCTYKIDNFLSGVDITVIDETGQPYELNSGDLQEEYLSRHCDRDERAEIEAFIGVFLDKYVAYTGSSKWDYRTNYYELEKYMLKGSDIQVRTYNSADSLMFGSYRSNILKEIEIHKIIDLGNGLYMCDITYNVDCLGTKGYITTVNDIRLIVIKTDSGYLAYEIPEKSTDTIGQ